MRCMPSWYETSRSRGDIVECSEKDEIMNTRYNTVYHNDDVVFSTSVHGLAIFPPHIILHLSYIEYTQNNL